MWRGTLQAANTPPTVGFSNVMEMFGDAADAVTFSQIRFARLFDGHPGTNIQGLEPKCSTVAFFFQNLGH